jgi:hypothetical protein
MEAGPTVLVNQSMTTTLIIPIRTVIVLYAARGQERGSDHASSARPAGYIYAWANAFVRIMQSSECMLIIHTIDFELSLTVAEMHAKEDAWARKLASRPRRVN